MPALVRIRPAAAAELADAVGWYESRRAGLGSELLVAVAVAIQSAAGSPGRHPLLHGPVRAARVRRFPYSVLFIDEPPAITVLAVFHARRNPLVWHSRA